MLHIADEKDIDGLLDNLSLQIEKSKTNFEKESSLSPTDNDETDIRERDDMVDEDVVGTKKKKKKKKDEEKKMTIEYFGTDLVQEGKDNHLDLCIGREMEIDQIMYTLLRKTKNNPLLIGEAGVGKTAIIEGLAQRIAD